MNQHESSWIVIMNHHELSWTVMNSNKSLWIVMSCHDQACIIMSCHEQYTSTCVPFHKLTQVHKYKSTEVCKYTRTQITTVGATAGGVTAVRNDLEVWMIINMETTIILQILLVCQHTLPYFSLHLSKIVNLDFLACSIIWHFFWHEDEEDNWDYEKELGWWWPWQFTQCNTMLTSQHYYVLFHHL